jgi:hypothetical protein
MNKPVAWISQDVLDADHIIKAVVRREQDEQHTIPLYTHPVKELTLTDDEVMELWNQASSHPAEFARAILRKAQEQ